MKELVVISGKGGTGKTSIVASFASLASNRAVLADVDVDAPDLHLVLDPAVQHTQDFVGGKKARVKPQRCVAGGTCLELCRFDAIRNDGPGNQRVDWTFRVDPLACEGCGVCAYFCESEAIEFAPVVSGQWFLSETRTGPMVHARLGVAAENSGKLVTLIRKQAQQLAVERELDLIICDGSPGIGCPVIASLTGADRALIVVEPSVSAFHDFHRVADLLARLGVPGLMIVNKADLNWELTRRLEAASRQYYIEPVGLVPYDPAVTRAQKAQQTVIEHSDSMAAQTIRSIWGQVVARLTTSVTSGQGGLVQLGNRQDPSPKEPTM